MKYIRTRMATYWQTLLLCIVLICSCCSKEEVSDRQAVGNLHIKLGISVRTYDAYSQLKAAQPDRFRVIIYTADATEIISYASASEVPESVSLPEGDYYVVAHSDNNIAAAFDNDYYYGESEIFTITAGQNEEVDVNCSLANIGVSVVYSANVIRDFSDYETRVSNPSGSLSFTRDESRTGFFNEGPLAIEAVLRYTNSEGGADSLVLNGAISNTSPGTHYEIHIEAELGIGALGINVNADESADTVVVVITEEGIVGSMTGELLITEIMYNPAATPDGGGEYIEVYNTTGASINMNGMQLLRLRGESAQSHTIGSDVWVASEDYVLLANSDTACSNVDYVYSGISLVNGGDTLMIRSETEGAAICMVDYEAEGFNTGLNGASLQLCPAAYDVLSALLGSNWEASQTTFSTGDLGSPGEVNAACE